MKSKLNRVLTPAEKILQESYLLKRYGTTQNQDCAHCRMSMGKVRGDTTHLCGNFNCCIYIDKVQW